MIKIDRVSYHGWNNVYRISNGCIELRVLADVGPRVLWYGLCDSENQFYEVADDFGKAGASNSGCTLPTPPRDSFQIGFGVD